MRRSKRPRRVGRYLINLCESTIVEAREDVTNVDSGFKAMLKRIGKVAMNDAICIWLGVIDVARNENDRSSGAGIRLRADTESVVFSGTLLSGQDHHDSSWRRTRRIGRYASEGAHPLLEKIYRRQSNDRH